MTNTLVPIRCGRSQSVIKNSPSLIWPERETRALGLGQDAEGKLLFYLQKDPQRPDAAVLIVSDGRMVTVTDEALSPFELHHPRCGPERLRKLMKESDPYGTWSRGTAIHNSVPRFLEGKGETNLATVFDVTVQGGI
jgi:hypothetical protein